MQTNTFNFLDVNLTIENNRISTSVYIKPTNNGTYSHYSSHTLLSYKISAVKTLVNRAAKLSSSWEQYHAEITRILQVFSNIDYPQRTIERIVSKSLQQFLHPSDDSANDDKINYFVQLHSVEGFKDDEKSLKSIINRFVHPILKQR